MVIPFLDHTVAIIASGIVIVVAFGIFSKIPPSVWFAWHPVLMTLAFPCLMVGGRWMYALDSSWGLDKNQRRVGHRALMGSGAIAMIFGYICILVAHSTGGQSSYFGYDFKKSEWKEWKRVAHGWLGFGVIILVFAQAFMGAMKFKLLAKTGERIYTFHGQLGKVILSMAILNILLAVWFWSWGIPLKIVVVVLALLCGAFGTVWPKAENVPAVTGQDATSEDAEVIGISDRQRRDYL